MKRKLFASCSSMAGRSMSALTPGSSGDKSTTQTTKSNRCVFTTIPFYLNQLVLPSLRLDDKAKGTSVHATVKPHDASYSSSETCIWIEAAVSKRAMQLFTQKSARLYLSGKEVLACFQPYSLSYSLRSGSHIFPVACSPCSNLACPFCAWLSLKDSPLYVSRTWV